MNTWKAVERKVAKAFGTTRNPLSGINGKHTASDTLHPRYFIEVKHGAGVPRSWRAKEKLLGKIRDEAAKESKIGMLVCHAKGSSDSIVYISGSDFLRILSPLKVPVVAINIEELSA